MKSIFRFATYNTRNLCDWYEERQKLLKQNIYSMKADVIGLQEVVFGPA